MHSPFAVVEGEEFLQLFPHRYDFIHQNHAPPGTPSTWKTESKYPLSDRQIQAGKKLFGVRFGKTTRYCLLDIDIGSPYHPQHDPFAIPRMVEALEPLGLVDYIPITSSYSNGLHLYFPFPVALKSWQVGKAVSEQLKSSGFSITGGLLEVFPNAKAYSEPLSLFNAHRLPLQSGSYLLDQDWHPVGYCRAAFVRRWNFAQSRNDIDQKSVKAVLNRIPPKLPVTQAAQKFLNDLTTEVETGWTAPGQTNRLLGRITLQLRIFGHLLFDLAEPLADQPLVEAVINTARRLPGFSEFCGHVSDLKQRVTDWVRSIQNSHYYPYGHRHGTPNQSTDTTRDWNQEQQDTARDHIRAIAYQLYQAGTLAAGITARCQQLASEGRFSFQTLYKHRDLWHPHNIDEINFEGLDPENFRDAKRSPLGDVEEASPSGRTTSLLETTDCNSSVSNGLSNYDSQSQIPECNFIGDRPSPEWFQRIREQLQRSKPIINQQAGQLMQASREERKALWKRQFEEETQRWLDSGDPILIAEAQSRLKGRSPS